MNIQFVDVPYAHILEFLGGEWGDMGTLVEWMFRKKIQTKQMLNN
jgi:hypothetical protein